MISIWKGSSVKPTLSANRLKRSTSATLLTEDPLEPIVILVARLLPECPLERDLGLDLAGPR